MCGKIKSIKSIMFEISQSFHGLMWPCDVVHPTYVLGWISQRVRTSLISSEDQLLVLTWDNPCNLYIS